jgi:hypothetical protein
MTKPPFFTGFLIKKTLCALAGVFLLCGGVSAADLKLDATLVWGSNDDKSPDPSHRPLDPVYAKKLAKIFKWKNYYEVNRMVVAIPSRQTKKLSMSKQCIIEITELEGEPIEVKLYGEGKALNKFTKVLPKGEIITFAGEDKNESAWFVMIKEADPKAPEGKVTEPIATPSTNK